jgi:hypothetical protein
MATCARGIARASGCSESVRKHSFGIAQLSQHQCDRGKLDECESVTVQVLPILGQSAATVKPRDSSFHHPSFGNDLEALGGVGAFDDFHRKPGQHLRQSLAESRPLITAVGEKPLQKWVEAEHRRHKQHAAAAILDIGRMDDRMEQQTPGIDQNVTLLATDFIARVMPLRVNPGAALGPRFSRSGCRSRRPLDWPADPLVHGI